MLTADILHMCSIRDMRRHSASGRPRRHVSFFDIDYELTTLPTRPSNPLILRQGRFGGRKSVPAARADRPLSGQLADLCQTAGANGEAPKPAARDTSGTDKVLPAGSMGNEAYLGCKIMVNQLCSLSLGHPRPAPTFEQPVPDFSSPRHVFTEPSH